MRCERADPRPRTRPRTRFGIALVAIALGAVPALAARAADLLILDARLPATAASPAREGVSIAIRDGRITAIGRDVAAGDLPMLDAGGATVVPGLVDAHAHLGWGPGAALRAPERPEDWGRFRAQHLRAYLACGVTTVLDPGAPFAVAEEIQRALAAGHPGPRYLTLGPIVMAPGGQPYGYPDGWWVAPASAEEVEATLDRLESLGAVGVKLYLERGGWSILGEAPVPSPEVRAAIARGAAARGLPVYVHATTEAEQRTALEMGAHALVHALQYQDEALSQAFVERMARSGAYQVTTFAAMDSLMPLFEPERLRDPLLDRVVPPAELAAARDPGTGWRGIRAQGRLQLPWLPDLLLRPLTRAFFREAPLRERLRTSQASVRRLHEAGVPIVLGSDTPFNPWVPYGFHGATTLRELEMIAEAGLSAPAALAAATARAAEMLGLADEIGSVEVGKRADLVIADGDPTRDVRALRRIRWTVRDGVARTPEQWLTAGE